MPTAPLNTNPAWSADGFNQWSADGFYGWTADGYEPTTLAAAITAASALGVNIGPITTAYDPGVPVGFVITGWSPLVNSAPVGSYVPVIISEGPMPGPTTLTVPNVVGKFYYDAQLALLQAGFLIDVPTFVLSSTVNPQYAISQSVAAGTTFTQQTLITITVSGFSVTNQPGIVVPVP
jgi:beta-lactam-binding protein with PASTA domain